MITKSYKSLVEAVEVVNYTIAFNHKDRTKCVMTLQCLKGLATSVEELELELGNAALLPAKKNFSDLIREGISTPVIEIMTPQQSLEFHILEVINACDNLLEIFNSVEEHEKICASGTLPDKLVALGETTIVPIIEQCSPEETAEFMDLLIKLFLERTEELVGQFNKAGDVVQTVIGDMAINIFMDLTEAPNMKIINSLKNLDAFEERVILLGIDGITNIKNISVNNKEIYIESTLSLIKEL